MMLLGPQISNMPFKSHVIVLLFFSFYKFDTTFDIICRINSFIESFN